MGKSKMSLKKIFQGANIEEEMYLNLYLCFCHIIITKIYIFFYWQNIPFVVKFSKAMMICATHQIKYGTATIKPDDLSSG